VRRYSGDAFRLDEVESLLGIEPTVIKGAAGDRPRQTRAIGLQQTLDIGDGGEAARRNHRNGQRFGERQSRLDIQAFQHAIARYVGIDDRRDAGVLEPIGKLERGQLGRRGPTLVTDRDFPRLAYVPLVAACPNTVGEREELTDRGGTPCLLKELARRKYEIGALVLNRALPESLAHHETELAAAELAADAAPIAAVTAEALGVDPAATQRVLAQTASSSAQWAVVARREAAARDRVSTAAPLVVTVPSLDDEVGDLSGILALGRALGAPT